MYKGRISKTLEQSVLPVLSKAVSTESFAKLEHRFRPGLAKMLDPEDFVKVYSSSRTWFLDMLASCRPHADAPVRDVEVCGVRFRNDLGNAAGFDKDGKLLAFNYLMGAGFGLIGTVLSHSHTGNLIDAYGKAANPWTPLPHSDSALNSLGLPNHGVDYVVNNIGEFRDYFTPTDFPIGASVMGHPAESSGQLKLAGVVKCLDKLLPEVDFIEINESCPNTAHSHDDLELRLKTMVSVRDSYEARLNKYVPIFAKLRDAGDPKYTVEFMTKIGVDGLVLTNTQIDYANYRKKLHPDDLKLFDYYTKHHKGGMSGPIIRDFAFSQVAATARAIKRQGSHLKLIHVGGLGSYSDMLKSRAISPDIVQLREWYTGLMTDIGRKPLENIYLRMIYGNRIST